MAYQGCTYGKLSTFMYLDTLRVLIFDVDIVTDEYSTLDLDTAKFMKEWAYRLGTRRTPGY
jgi:hypothetical protein